MPDLDAPAPSEPQDASPAPADTSSPSSQPVGAAPSEPSPAPAVTPDPAPQTTEAPSQVVPVARNPSQVDPAAPAVDWQKRHGDATAYAQKLNEQVRAMQAQLEPWQGLDPRQVRELVERQKQQAAQSSLKPWHPRHPEAAQTDARLGRVKNFLTASRGIPRDLPPEQQQAMKRAFAAEFGVTDADATLYQEHEQYVQGALNEFTRDPQSYIEQHTQAAIQRALAEYEQFQSTKIQTQQFLTDPKNAPVIKEHADTILWAMNHPQRRDVGITLAQVMAERDALKAQIGKQAESVATAEARNQALRGKANVSRDPRTSPVVTGDPVKDALAKGLKGDALIKHLENSRAQVAQQAQE